MRRILREASVLQAGQFAMIVIQAATNLVMIRVLGASLLGTYTLVQSLVGIADILDISGSGQVVVNQLSRAIGSKDIDEIHDVLAYFWRINLQINLPLVALFFFIVPSIAQTLYHNTTISMLVRWQVLTQLTDIPTQTIIFVYQCRGNLRRLVLYETSKIVLTSGVTLAALLLGWGLEGIVFGSVAVGLIYALISAVLYHQLAASDSRFPSWRAIWQRMKLVKMRDRFRLGFMIALERNLRGLVDKAILLLFGTMGTSFVGKFSIALKIITLPQPMISGLARYLDTFMPKRAGKNPNDLRSMFVRLTLYSGAIWAVLTLSLAIAAPIALLIFFPNDTDVVPLLYPLLLQSLAIGLGVGIGSTIRTLGRMEFPVVLEIVEIMVTVTAGYYLIHGMGLYGAAWLYAMDEFLFTIVMIVIVYRLLRPRDSTMTTATVRLGENPKEERS